METNKIPTSHPEPPATTPEPFFKPFLTLCVVALAILFVRFGVAIVAHRHHPSQNANVLGATTDIGNLRPANVGVYYWGPPTLFPANTAVAQSLRYSDKLGVDAIRITLSPNTYYLYSTTGQCIQNYTLTNMAKAFFQPIFEDPQYKVVIINTYDAASNPSTNCQVVSQAYLNPAFDAANGPAIEKEYTDLATYLKQFTGKTFILMNDQGDLHIWGYNYPPVSGGLNALSQDPGAYTADAQGNITGGNMLGFIDWMKDRYAGIKAANASNVLSGIEFDDLHLTSGCPGYPDYVAGNATAPCLKNILSSVLPVVPHDVTSYSAYESSNVSAVQLSSDIDSIYRMPGTNNLIIGEFGYAASDPDAAVKTQQVLDVAAEKGIPTAIAWNLFDDPQAPVSQGFGAFDGSMNLTAVGKALEPPAEAPTPTPTSTPTRVPAVKATPTVATMYGYVPATGRYIVKSLVTNSYVVIFGSNFSPSGNTVSINGVAYTASRSTPAYITYQSTSQINVYVASVVGSTASIVVTTAGRQSSAPLSVPVQASSTAPAITGEQYYGTGGYANTVIDVNPADTNPFMVLYGTFPGLSGQAPVAGVTVSIDGDALSSANIKYASSTQINVSLLGINLSGSTATVTVATNDGTSAPISLPVEQK